MALSDNQKLEESEEFDNSGPFKSPFGSYISSQKPLFSLSRKIWNPPADVVETQEDIQIKIEVAGVQQDQFHITMDNNVLVVRGNRMEESCGDKVRIHLLEMNYGQFERIFKFPECIQIEDVKATYSNGFLRIKVKKTNKQPNSISITIDTPE